MKGIFMAEYRVGSEVKIDFSVVQGILGEDGGMPLAIVRISDEINALGTTSLDLVERPIDPDPNQGVLPYKRVGAGDYAYYLIRGHNR